MSKVCRILHLRGYNCNGYHLCKNLKQSSCGIIMLNYRCYEGKPFDRNDKDWPEQQERNRSYDINQNIYNFRKQEEEKMRQRSKTDKAKQAYDRHRDRMERGFHDQGNNENGANQNWKTLGFGSDIKSENQTNANNVAKYGAVGLIGLIGIGFIKILFIKTQ